MGGLYRCHGKKTLPSSLYLDLQIDLSRSHSFSHHLILRPLPHLSNFELDLTFRVPLVSDFTNPHNQNVRAPPDPTSLRHLDMPLPKIFKRFTSKKTPKSNRGVNPAPDVSKTQEKDTSSKALVTAAVVPSLPDHLREAWAAANKELPQAKGAEKLLNRVGQSNR